MASYPPIPPNLKAGSMDAVENLSSTGFYQRRADSSATIAPSLSVAILYNGLRVADMSVAESLSKIRSFVHSSSRITAARNLRGEEAQELIDHIDQVRP
jgi:hypothetical protein